jgi:hypothetical protein
MQELIDQIADSYLSWREECYALDAAYARWARAESEDRAAAYAAYRAQLELEEHAARCYQQINALAAPCPDTLPQPIAA